MPARLVGLIVVVGLLVGGALPSPATAAVVHLPTSHEIAASPVPDRGTGAANASSYFGARYYRPDIGRFTTVDPGHVGGNIFDPQSWNAYAYAKNNPVRFVDPDGRYWRYASGLSTSEIRAITKAIAAAIQHENAREMFLAIAADPRPVTLGVENFINPRTTARTYYPALPERGYTTSVTFDFAAIRRYHRDRTGSTTFTHELWHVKDALYASWFTFQHGDPGAYWFAEQTMSAEPDWDSLAALELVQRTVVLSARSLAGFAELHEYVLPSRSLAGFAVLA